MKLLSVLDVPADAPKVGMAIVSAPGPGLSGALVLAYDAVYRVPTTELHLKAIDSLGSERARFVYPPAPIPAPPHLEPFFTGRVARQIDARGTGSGTEWTLCADSSEWNGGAFGFSNLRWERNSTVFRRPSVRWQFTPLCVCARWSAFGSANPTNCGSLPLNGVLLVHLRGSRLLPCGEALANWPQNFPADLNTSIELAPRESRKFLCYTFPKARRLGAISAEP